jgi:hypothetical protein
MGKELLKSHKMFYSSFKLRCKGFKTRGEELSKKLLTSLLSSSKLGEA